MPQVILRVWIIIVDFLAKCFWAYPMHIVLSEMVLVYHHIVKLLTAYILSILLRTARINIGHLASAAVLYLTILTC